MKTEEITNSQDIIDSRDIIARIDYLRGELDSLISDVADAGTTEDDAEARAKLAEWLGCSVDDLPENPEALNLKEYDGSDEARELFALESLAEEAEGYADDWKYGAALIRDSYFEDYARELAEDIGDIKGNERWPFTCIDWKKAAEELQMDYTQVDFAGVAYWIR